MKKIGFLVNPIAGMGGAVGLKGTDGDAFVKAVNLGARPIASERAKRALQDLHLRLRDDDLLMLTCSDRMGEDVLKETGLLYNIVYDIHGKTSAADTREACKRFLASDVDLVLFCGGDGTARDVYSVIRTDIPMLGIPAGVKMYSGVFAIDPVAVCDLLEDLFSHQKDSDLERPRIKIRDAEVIDIDENAYRDGTLKMEVFGYAKTPYKPTLVQGRKFVFYGEDEEVSKKAIGRFASEFMRDGSLYILGAGTTTKVVADALNLKKTLLGVDVIKDGRLIKSDTNENDLLNILKDEKSKKIIVSPIGAQGFIFGRGNQQISSKVIRKVGIENVIVIATPYKLEQTPHLFVDTGDADLDRLFSGCMSVVCGYRMAQRKEVLGARKVRSLK
ncbi:MAG: ATP-NAD kinase [Candidatus Methanolliviera sp. GoM_asphalt]|nr:MAG: ATP-NAD kinase [Candidatus Methanolliviera sp. GoM_asphalt]